MIRILIALLTCASGQAYALSMKVTYAADAFFDPNESQQILAPGRAKLIDLVAKIDAMNLEVIIAVGHADAQEKNPQAVSDARALTIKCQFIKFGIAPDRIYTEGKAAQQPVSWSDAKNRRVEIEVVGTRADTSHLFKKTGFPPVKWWHLQEKFKGQNFEETLPDRWSNDERDALEIVEFISTIGAPYWRDIFASRLLVEAIWRQDDQLTQQAYDERQIARAILTNKNNSHWDFKYPDPAFHAAAYGSDFAWKLLGNEMRDYSVFDFTRHTFFKDLICKQPPYGSITLAQLQRASQRLFPKAKFFEKFEATTQLETQNCAASQAETLKWLFAAGGNPDLTNVNGQTMLHEEILRRGGRDVALYIHAGVNVNTADSRGNTALHYVQRAVRLLHLPMMPNLESSVAEKQKIWDALIHAGANPQLKNKAQQLPVKP